MSDKPVENVDIVAAILTVSVVMKKPERTFTPQRPFNLNELTDESVTIFKNIKDKLEK